MSDEISQSTITQIGEVLKDDGVISNEDLQEGIQYSYSVIQDTANTVPLYSLSITWGSPIPSTTLDKIQTVLVSDGLIPVDSSNSVQNTIYGINYSANNQIAFSISKGATL